MAKERILILLDVSFAWYFSLQLFNLDYIKLLLLAGILNLLFNILWRSPLQTSWFLVEYIKQALFFASDLRCEASTWYCPASHKFYISPYCLTPRQRGVIDRANSCIPSNDNKHILPYLVSLWISFFSIILFEWCAGWKLWNFTAKYPRLGTNIRAATHLC
jgi:hypothetical protein